MGMMVLPHPLPPSTQSTFELWSVVFYFLFFWKKRKENKPNHQVETNKPKQSNKQPTKLTNKPHKPNQPNRQTTKINGSTKKTNQLTNQMSSTKKPTDSTKGHQPTKPIEHPNQQTTKTNPPNQ